LERDKALYLHRVFNIYRAFSKRVMDEHDNLATEFGLTSTQFHLLYHIYVNQGMSLSELSWKLRLDNSVVTGLIKRLEAKKLLRTETSLEDRRVSLVFLTEEGIELRQETEKRMQESPFFSFLDNQNPVEQERLLNELIELYQRIWPGKDYRFFAYIFNSDPWEKG